MALSLKISNIVGNELELILRLKKVNSPGKKKLLKSLANGDWIAIYTELLFRIELYTETKVLNYTRKDLNTFVVSIRAIGIDKIAQALVEKYITPEQQVASQLVIDESLVNDSISEFYENLEDSEEFKNNCALYEFRNLIEKFNLEIEKKGLDKSNLWEYVDGDEEFGMINFDLLNPTDLIIEEIGYERADIEIDDESLVEEIYSKLIQYFESFVEVSLNESEGFLNLDESFKKIFS